MNKEERKLQIRTERHIVNSEIRKSNNPAWLEKWVDKLDEEMDKAHEITSYAKKTKVGKAKRKR